MLPRRNNEYIKLFIILGMALIVSAMICKIIGKLNGWE